MEKYRLFGDPSSGIQPFVNAAKPSTVGRLMAAVVYPFRVVLCLCFMMLITLIDVLIALLSSVYLGFIAGLLLLPMLRCHLLRILMFFMGHLSISSLSEGSGPQAASMHLRSGDVLIANLQSAWDPCVIEAALGLGRYAVAFPTAGACSSKAQGGDHHHHHHAEAGVKLFLPGPFQRWRVWSYITTTTSIKFLSREVAALTASSSGGGGDAQRSSRYHYPPQHHSDDEDEGSGMVNVGRHAQSVAYRHHVPVIYFMEGTTSNGKGVLQSRGFSCYAAGAFAPKSFSAALRSGESGGRSGSGGGGGGARVWTAALRYETPAFASLSPEAGSSSGGVTALLASMWRASSLLYGAVSSSSSSRWCPRALVYVHALRVEEGDGDDDRANVLHHYSLGDEQSHLHRRGDHTQGSAAAAKKKHKAAAPSSSSSSASNTPTSQSSSSSSGGLLQCRLSGQQLLAVRHALCRGTQGQRRPLEVGMTQKLEHMKVHLKR